MPKTPILLLVLLLPVLLFSQVFPVNKIINNGEDAKRINFVILPDGYTAGELADFVATHAPDLSAAIFNKTPFKEYVDFFNVHIIQVPSVESGADHPGTATDVSEPAFPVSAVNTYFSSSFDVANIHRLLVPSGPNMADVLADNYPGYDQALVLVNSQYYGGSGGWLATASLDASSSEVMIHEIGHSFAGLGDEYWFNCNEAPNRTSDDNPTTNKWKNWIGTAGVNIYPYGASSPQSDCFRPHEDCEMRFLNREFCAVCREAFIDKIYSLVTPIEMFMPATNNVMFTGTPIDFELSLVYPVPNTLSIVWKLDGNPIANDVTTLQLTTAELPVGNHSLVACVTDETTLSKSYLPAAGYVFTQTWTIESTTPTPLDWLSFNAYAKTGYNELTWETAREVNVKEFIVERSGDGLVFGNLAGLPASQTKSAHKNYTYYDKLPAQRKNYYRIKQVDFDGRYTYSPVRVIESIGRFFYKVYPNPLTNFVYVQIQQDQQDGPLTWKLLDVKGSVLKQNTEKLTAGTNSFSIELGNLQAGSYFLELQSKEIMERIPLVKQ